MSFLGSFDRISSALNKKSMINEMQYIWMDGDLIEWKEAKLHVLSHSLHYGGAVFEGIRCYETVNGPALFRLEDHIKRLLYSASALEFDVSFSEKDLIDATLNIVKQNNLKSGYIRPLIFAGYGQMGLKPKGAKIHTCISCWPWGSYLGEHLIKLEISSLMRIHPASTDIQAKISGHYANSIMASQKAMKNGFDEALLLDYEGNVAEGPGENIFMVKNSVIKTPEAKNILKGITRDSIIKIAKDKGYKLEETIISPNELKKADEVFLTGTAAEISPVGQIDDTMIGSGEAGPITSSLKSLFTDIINGENSTYNSWLSYV